MLAEVTQTAQQLAELSHRLSVSPGVNAVRPPRTLFGDQLIFGMFVLRPEWRPLRPSELVAISRDGFLQRISLARPEARLIAALRSAWNKIKSTQPPNPDATITRCDIPHPLAQKVLASALGEQVDGTRLISASLRQVVSVPPLGTSPASQNQTHGSTTFYPDSDKAIGLHLDTWAHKRDFVQSGRPYRCIVNIGQDSRYVAFVNRSAEDISQAIEAAYPGLNADQLLEDNPQEWAQRFLLTERDHPVMRLKILPGEAYVMDTHACIHDGSAVQRTSADIFVILSFIKDRL